MKFVNFDPMPDFHALIMKPKYTPEWQAAFGVLSILSYPPTWLMQDLHAYQIIPHLRPAVTEEKPRTVRE